MPSQRKMRSNARKSRSHAKKVHNNPKSRKSCAKRNMKWVDAHKSHDAKGKRIMVKGACRKKHNEKSM
jgi:hypothetical protein